MPRASITSLRNRFNSEIEKSFRLIQIITSNRVKLSKKYVFSVVELSFIKICVAWEEFLENTFIGYSMGQKTQRGYDAKSYINPKNINHAKEFVHEGRKYSNWNEIDELKRKARRFFKRDPYNPALSTINAELGEVKEIRNAIAHGSRHSKEKFKSVVRSRLGYLPSGITIGDFLFKMESQTGKTFLIFMPPI